MERGCDPTKEDIYGWCSLHAAYYSEKEMDDSNIHLAKDLQELLIQHIKKNSKNSDTFFENFDKHKKKNMDNRIIFASKSGLKKKKIMK